MNRVSQILARASEGAAAAFANNHAHPEIVPDWESMAIAAFPFLILFTALVL